MTKRLALDRAMARCAARCDRYISCDEKLQRRSAIDDKKDLRRQWVNDCVGASYGYDLPRNMTRSEYANPESGIAQSVGQRALRVLVVDDDRDTVISLLAVLRHEGFETQGAHDGQSALKALELFAPDVAVIDIAMPRMSGWEIAREIRLRHRSRPLLIAISGTYVKPPDEMLSRIAGFNHFLLKPCDPNFLVQILRSRLAGMPAGDNALGGVPT